MGKGANKQLLANAGTGQTNNKQLTGQASETYGFLDPTLMKDVTNPQGFWESDLNAMNTAAQQSSGGSTAAVTGEANLEAARTRNAGGFQGAIGEGTRTAQKQLSQNAVSIQAEQAKAKLAQRSQALDALQKLYGVDQATALSYLNSSNSALGAENQNKGFGSTLLTDVAGGIGKGVGTIIGNRGSGNGNDNGG